MENSQSPSPIPSLNSHSSNCSTTTTNGLRHRLSPPPPSVPVRRFDPNNPYTTTFVQADTSSFKQVVQMLTGSTETTTTHLPTRPEPVRNHIPVMKTGSRKDKSGSKLYERRNILRNLNISPLSPGFNVNTTTGFSYGYSGSGSPRQLTPEILSPSILDFPALALSPVTPLLPDPFHLHVNKLNTAAAEEKAIKEKGFYLHPSPANTPRDSEPRLLPLFPVTSPRVAGSSTSDDC